MQNGHTGKTLAHGLKFPAVVVQSGPRVADPRNVSVLTALENFLQYANVPPFKVRAAARLLTRALEMEDQYLWNYSLNVLQMETSKGGFRAKQAENVLIAEQQAKARMEALSTLAKMGPKPKEAEEAPA